MLLKDGRELTIRRATKDDAKEMLDYLSIAGGETDNLTFGTEGVGKTIEEEAGFLESDSNREPSAILVGFVDGKMVGSVGLYVLTRARVAHLGEIGITVLKEFWGLGIGTYFMQEIIDLARKTETVEILYLGTKAENTRAQELYKKFGFKEFGRFPAFFKINGEYFDEIKMILNL